MLRSYMKDMNVKVLYEFKNQNLKFNFDKC